MNVNVVNVRNVYSKTVIVNNVHSAFNGPGGIEARPTRQEEEYGRERHTAALGAQTEHEHAASQNRQLFASENHGRPAIAATARPGEFSGRNVERASAAGEPYREPKMSPQEARGTSADNHAGNRGFNEPARNGGNSNYNSNSSSSSNSNDRSMTRPENNGAGSRGQMSSRDNPKPNSKPSKQEKQAQKKAQKQAKAEQKHQAREDR